MNSAAVLFACVALAFLAGLIVLSLRERRRRKKFFDAPFPRAWEKILRRNVPAYAFLPTELRKNFHRRIKEFLSEKTFEACGGLPRITDEIALTIAGGASLLVAARAGTAWRTLHSVLVYPGAFAAPGAESESDDGLVRRERGTRDGESWTHGSVVFSWQRITRDIALHGNGQNVVFHEFAHQLDSDDGIAGGRPNFADPADAHAWAEVSARELARLRNGDAGTVIDEYGAENPAEFFATSVEAFFEKSTAMKAAHPELYALLKKFFALDPASWNYS